MRVIALGEWRCSVFMQTIMAAAGGRFASLSTEQLNELLSSKGSKNTKLATQYAARVFHEYCVSRHGYMSEYGIDTVQEDTLDHRYLLFYPPKNDRKNDYSRYLWLDKLLESFYAEARNKNGEKYSTVTLRSIRNGLQRYFNEPPLRRNFDIVNGPSFMQSRAMFEATTFDLKKSGKGNVNHKPVINEIDKAKLKDYFSMFSTHPKPLLHKVWFDIMYNFCRRGREGLRELSKHSYTIKTDENALKYIVKSGSEVTKNHRSDRKDCTGGVILESPTDPLCPVKSFELYLRKLNKKCDAFFQRPKDNFCFEDEEWFENKPLGKNYLGELMSKISKSAGLSQAYSNHSIRATTITTLSDAGYDTRHIQSVSKHKNIQSIESYSRDTSLKQKRSMSCTLSSSLYCPGGNEVVNIPCMGESTTIPAVTNSNYMAPPSPKRLLCSTNYVNGEIQRLSTVNNYVDELVGSPHLNAILSELVSQTDLNVCNNYCSESSMGRNVNISNVSGGVFNIYVQK